ARVITITNKANGDLTPFLLTAAGLGGAGPAIPSGATREILLDLDTLRRWQSSPSPSRSLPPLFPRDRKGRFASSANVPRTEAGPRETELSYVALLLRDAPRPIFETGIDADAESGTTVFLIPLET
ncbi:MAG TPA: hypothetical protein VK116_05550, partial [Planctomycetota bacterium]|nr:hypothetical protein [Planctomycetota bacterium]